MTNLTPTDIAAYLRKNGFKQPANLYVSAPPIQRRKERGTGHRAFRKAESMLERKFAQLWEAAKGPPLEREYRALPDRRFRWDFANLPAKLLIELNGGNFGRVSAHNSGVGIERDAAKARAAVFAGWTTITLTTREVNGVEVEKLIQFCRDKAALRGGDQDRGRP